MSKVPKTILHIVAVSPEKHKIDFFCLQINPNVFYKLILSVWVCTAIHSQSTWNNKFTTSLQYLKESKKDEVDFCLQLFKVSSKWYYLFRCVGPGMPKLPKIKRLLFLYQYLKKEVNDEVHFLHAGKHENYKLILWFWWRWSSISKVSKIASLQCLYNISKKKLDMKLIFCMQINIKVIYKLVSTLWAPTFSIRSYYHYWWACWSIAKVLKVTSLQVFAISQKRS